MGNVAAIGSPPPSGFVRFVRPAIILLITLLAAFAAWTLYVSGMPSFGALILVIAVGFAVIFGYERFYAARFFYPGVAAVLVFIAFPVLYTVYLGFTNYGSFNLLTYERVREVLTTQKVIDAESTRPFAVFGGPGAYRVFLPEGAGGFVSEPLALDGSAASVTTSAVDAPPAELLNMRDVVKLRAGLAEIEIILPDGTALRSAGLRNFASVTPEYEELADGALRNTETGEVLTPDHDQGFYLREDGTKVPPGWRTNIGFGNFVRIFTSEGIRAPLVSIFIWTMVFATVSVVGTFAVGLLLASILQWPHLGFKPVYRILLILPYAVPAFISILVFKGLFNQNFGEINMILEALFGVRPTWNTDGFLARIMILIVNIWLGYPYMMLLAMGFLQAVPEDHKKAATLEGAGMLRVFFTITLPQILPPFLPLLIASFAFNFNNVVLILLLTRGAPDMPGTIVPAGQTDILASFTYRMAFVDSGTQFGLAGAITLLIFIVVSIIAYLNFVAMRRAADKRGGVHP